MDREARSQIIAITAIGLVVIMLAAFLWPGPGGLPFPAGPTMLSDEALVEEIYHRVSPAVVEIYADIRTGDSYEQTSAGSGFLIDSEGYIATNYHVIERADRVRVSFVNVPTWKQLFWDATPPTTWPCFRCPRRLWPVSSR